jgi:serine/threonine protein kinase/predicted Zn-dependent protease
MNGVASGLTWEQAASPEAVRLTRRYEEAWQEARRRGVRLDPAEYLAETRGGDGGARLAVLRADLSLRWEVGERPSVGWYLERFSDFDEETIVALIYEEFCQREEHGEAPDPQEYLQRYASYSERLRRVLEIHRLVGTASTAGSTTFLAGASRSAGLGVEAGSFPEAGQTIGGFHLVEELGRGAFARVFLAREQQLADRFVALKVTRRASREPQTLARLQHTHIVPVYSHRIDRGTGLHLLCMPYFGRVTLTRILEEVRNLELPSGASLVEALDRLSGPGEGTRSRRMAGRIALSKRSYAQAVAWWGARLAEALGHAHDQGVLHRDIKPSNVLIADDGMPMLLDFNLAREPVPADCVVAEAETLGGTFDYMAPEHLTAIVEGRADATDSRADIYGMGVLLFEAVSGEKPFPPPARGRTVLEALIGAANERRRDPRRLFADGRQASFPPPLAAVVIRCLEPDPDDRYQTSSELAADLQAVADDLALVHAWEPWRSRIRRRLRRNSRSLATAAVILLAGIATLGSFVYDRYENSERYLLVQQLCDQGSLAFNEGDYSTATIRYETALQVARQTDRNRVRHLLSRRTLRRFGESLRQALSSSLWSGLALEELEDLARRRVELSKRIDAVNNDAQRLHDYADTLRFRLIGLGEDLPGAVEELKRLLAPFYVLSSKEDWTTLQHTMPLLDPPRRELLREEVGELLFLWMVGIEHSLRQLGHVPQRQEELRERERAVDQALEVCDRALQFTSAKGPWRALRAELETYREPSGGSRSSLPHGAVGGGPSLLGEPKQVADEPSALACFQWGLLCSSQGRRTRAIEWLQRAVWLEWSNYWYQFYLAYLEDQAGFPDDALDHYSVAVAQRANSPWVRFNRARIYRAKGRWAWAIDDLNRALELLHGRPEALQVRLELGYLHQALGEYARARAEYREVIRQLPGTAYARAARLNLANIDAETGRADRARASYARLLQEDPQDHAARFSRALLNLREGNATAAREDLDSLLNSGIPSRDHAEVVAARSVARLVLGDALGALDDAKEARQLRPSPAHDRLWNRALLASRTYGPLHLRRPQDLELLPLNGDLLNADLEAAVAELTRQAGRDDESAFRAALNLAVIHAFRRDHISAAAAAARAASLAPFSPHVHFIRAQLHRLAGKLAEAQAEIERGLELLPDHPGLLELRAGLRMEANQPESALHDLDLAIAGSSDPSPHVLKACVLGRLGKHDDAVHEWTIALRLDPQSPQAFLGRARSYAQLQLWDQSLADLEQAAAWSHGHPRLELGIVSTYLQCLPERPHQAGRWFVLARRTLLHLAAALSSAIPAGRPEPAH